MSDIKTKKKNSRPAVAGRNSKSVSRRSYEMIRESDSTYLLKLVIYVILATLWIKFSQPISWHGYPIAAIPLGLIVGLIVVRLVERMQEDRKIWYAVLIIVGIVTYYMPAGIVL